ncbi:hypothetical protein LguiA_023665 [Lonicera macranthoides]
MIKYACLMNLADSLRHIAGFWLKYYGQEPLPNNFRASLVLFFLVDSLSIKCLGCLGFLQKYEFFGWLAAKASANVFLYSREKPINSFLPHLASFS